MEQEESRGVKGWLERLSDGWHGRSLVRPNITGVSDVRGLDDVDFSGMRLRKAAPASEVAILRSDMGLELPADYAAFIERYDGGEGWLGGRRSPLNLRSILDIPVRHRGYQVERFKPGFIIFGSSGEGDAYAFDTWTTPWVFVTFPFADMWVDDLDAVIAETFRGFLIELQRGWPEP